VIYHGTNKPKSRNILKNADVVLTTYHTMANESDIQVCPLFLSPKTEGLEPGATVSCRIEPRRPGS
jgi:hypothetical protein